jgi:SagB-type dehydrogenase family enzyme
MAVLGTFMKPADVAALDGGPSARKAVALCGLLIRAGVLQPCDGDGRTQDESRPERRQWELHDAIFHSRSRLGRTEQRVGATWSFKGELSQAPATKIHPWTQHVIDLPRADLTALHRMDMSLMEAMETRRSVRFNSIVPLTARELGVFLYRTARIRYRSANADGEITSRPYPGGGGLYEVEIYVTIDRCADLPRGFYYYDAERHALCLISGPDRNSESLLEEARMATAGICRPQILLTLASRHTRVSWKYSGMAYSTQLKNVGVLYQTLYLVATAMNLGGCALGLGNTDRFLAMTGLDWFEEGSVGEFILGRPL